MAETNEFKTWHRMEVSRRLGVLERIEQTVDREMRKIKVEVRQEGLWTEVDKNDPLSDEENGETT